jgi:hypothetical protein
MSTPKPKGPRRQSAVATQRDYLTALCVEAAARAAHYVETHSHSRYTLGELEREVLAQAIRRILQGFAP